jgi:outer membrane lipoprotein-sorting protein
MTPDHPETVRSLQGLAEVDASPERVARALERVRSILLSPEPVRVSPRQTILSVTRIAAGILLAVGIGGLVWWFINSGSGAALAFSDVEEKVQKTQTVTFKWIHERKGQPVEIERVWIKAAGLLRVEFADGRVMITDYTQRKSLTLDPDKKEAKIIQGLGLSMPNIYEMLRDIPKDTVKPLPDKEIGGKQVPGFLVRIAFGKSRHDASVWIDRQTRLPVRMEMAGKDDKGREAREVMKDLVFDQALDAALFSLAPPAGYKTQTEGIAELPPLPKEPDVIAPVLTPKVGIGPAKFGMSKDEVIRVLGKPDAIPKEGRGQILQYLSRGYILTVTPQRGLVIISCASQKAFLPKVRDFRGKTRDGIGIGTAAKDIEKAYGKPDRRENNGPATLYLSYHRLGIDFTLFDDKVVQIMLQKP